MFNDQNRDHLLKFSGLHSGRSYIEPRHYYRQDLVTCTEKCIRMDFLGWGHTQNSVIVTSCCLQQVYVGSGLLQEAFQGERECSRSLKGMIMEGNFGKFAPCIIILFLILSMTKKIRKFFTNFASSQ